MNAADTAALLRRTADAVESGKVTPPLVDLQFIVTTEADPDAAMTATAALFPGTAWQGNITRDPGGPYAHLHGRGNRLHVVVSAKADAVRAETVTALTERRPA